MTESPPGRVADVSQGIPQEVPPGSTPDDFKRLLMAGGSMPGEMPSKGSLRRKIIGAVLIAAIGVGASAMSCVGQSFSYRQARAMEGIEQQLRELRASCGAQIAPRTP